MTGKPELYIKKQCVIGEGPVWDERDQTLYYIDLLGGKIFHHGKTDEELDVQETVGHITLRENGGMIAGLLTGWYELDFPSGTRRFIAWPEADRDGTRFNDGKADPAGRMWAGTMPLTLDTGAGEAGPDAALYCMDADRKIAKMADDIIQSNGMAWSKDGKKFYFVDTQRRVVFGYDYDLENNVLSGKRVAVTIPKADGIPDGMTIDDNGNLWIALWDGYGVAVYDPETGKMLEKITLPVPKVTACCFGGPEMKDLFITTASLETDMEEYPLAGSVFAVRTDVSGTRSHRYKG